MNKILIPSLTQIQLDRFINKPSHALLILGSSGIGKLELAKYISTKILGFDSSSELDNYPYFNVFYEDHNLISIDKVREIKQLFKLRTTGKQTIRRIVVIDNVSSMSNEAQNAILKILEEPPEDSILILTSPTSKVLNPTIVSRTQIIKAHRPDLESSIEYFKKLLFKEADIKQAYLFSGGSIGLMKEILQNEDENNLLLYLNEAKEVLRSEKFNKLLYVDDWSKDKDVLELRLFSLKRVINAALQLSIENRQDKVTLRMFEALKQIQFSENALIGNVNTKLLLTNLFVKL